MEDRCGYEPIRLEQVAAIDTDEIRRILLSAELAEERYNNGELACVHVTTLGAAVLSQLLYMLYRDNIELALAVNETNKFAYMYDIAHEL